MSYTIKGLEWRRDKQSNNQLWADTIFGSYCIDDFDGHAEWEFIPPINPQRVINKVATLDVAKKRCQNHYEMALGRFLLLEKDPAKPLYTHDSCPNCRFIGSALSKDFWVCDSPKGKSYILRHSSDGPDYTSHPDPNNAKRAEMKVTHIGFAPDVEEMITFMQLLKGEVASAIISEMKRK